MKVLVVIPAYNEEESIEAVVEELLGCGYGYDYVVVNDGSTDRTREICRRRGFAALHLPINLGIGGAVQTGYQYALARGYDVAVQLDGDGQHDPRCLPDLIAPLREGRADYAIGSRYIENGGFQSTRLRKTGIQLLSGLLRLFGGQRVYDATSGLRAVNRGLIRLFSEVYAQDYPEPEAILQAARGGYRVCEVPVAMRKRQRGKSSIHRWGAVYYMVKVMLSIAVNRMIQTGEAG